MSECERIEEYLEENTRPVLALREGTGLRRVDDELALYGLRPARLFQRGEDPREIQSPADVSDLLD